MATCPRITRTAQLFQRRVVHSFNPFTAPPKKKQWNARLSADYSNQFASQMNHPPTASVTLSAAHKSPGDTLVAHQPKTFKGHQRESGTLWQNNSSKANENISPRRQGQVLHCFGSSSSFQNVSSAHSLRNIHLVKSPLSEPVVSLS